MLSGILWAQVRPSLTSILFLFLLIQSNFSSSKNRWRACYFNCATAKKVISILCQKGLTFYSRICPVLWLGSILFRVFSLVHQPQLQKSVSSQKQKIFSVRIKTSTFTVFELLSFFVSVIFTFQKIKKDYACSQKGSEIITVLFSVCNF